MSAAGCVPWPLSPIASPMLGQNAMSNVDAESPALPTHIQVRRLPGNQHDELRVRSLSCPTIGCTTMPEIGPASHATDSSAGGKPNSCRTGVTFAYWAAHAMPATMEWRTGCIDLESVAVDWCRPAPPRPLRTHPPRPAPPHRCRTWAPSS